MSTATPTLSLNVRDFGAIGDGVADDTAAIQRAIDAAGAVKGAVDFPPGVYATGRLQLRDNMALVGIPTWGYCDNGGTILKLNDPAAPCLLDLTGTRFNRIIGLSLVGLSTGKPTYPADGRGQVGIHIDGLGHKSEETLEIDHTRVAHFSGHGIELLNVWGFAIRHSMVIFNGGDGLHFTRWDGWVNDSVFNNCAGYAIHAARPNGAMTYVGNRIEWCYKGGIRIDGGNSQHINGNYFDRCGGPAVHISGAPEHLAATFAVTGNLMKRNGAHSAEGSQDSCHMRFEHVAGLVATSNTMVTGVNDSGQGILSPSFGIVVRGLKESIVAQNVMHQGAIQALVVDHGGHDEQSIVRDNLGSLKAPPAPPAPAQQAQQSQQQQ